MSGVVKAVGSVGKNIAGGLGFGGGAGEARDYATDPEAYAELYNQALAQMQGVGQDAASMKNRQAIEGILADQLGGLEDNAAGRKQNFLEDMSRSFQADTQSLARSRGGTGTLAQALRPSGEMYDAQARATSRGLNDLYSQATQDLGALQGVQGNLYGQDLSKATNVANIYGRELDSRRGTNTKNLENQWNAQQAMYGRLGKTVGMLSENARKGAGAAAGGAGGAA